MSGLLPKWIHTGMAGPSKSYVPEYTGPSPVKIKEREERAKADLEALAARDKRRAQAVTLLDRNTIGMKRRNLITMLANRWPLEELEQLAKRPKL